jgi:hypothetical protein
LPGILQLIANDLLFLKKGLGINPMPHSAPDPAQGPLKFVSIQCWGNPAIAAEILVLAT